MIVVKKITLIILYVVFLSIAVFGQLYYPHTIPYLSSAKMGEHFTNALNASFNASVIPI